MAASALLCALILSRSEDTPVVFHKSKSNSTKSSMFPRFRAWVGRYAKRQSSNPPPPYSNNTPPISTNADDSILSEETATDGLNPMFGCDNKTKDVRTKSNNSDHHHHHQTKRRDQQALPTAKEQASGQERVLRYTEFNNNGELKEHVKEDVRAIFIPSHGCKLHHTGIADQPPSSYAKNALDHIITETYLGVYPLLFQRPFMTRAHADAAIRAMINDSIDKGLERMKLCAKMEEARHLDICCSQRDSDQTREERIQEGVRYISIIKHHKGYD